MRIGRIASLFLTLAMIPGFFLFSSGVNRQERIPGGSGEDSVFQFEKSPQIFPSAVTYQIQLADLDGDGDLDAVFANMGLNDGRVYFNDGKGKFTDSGQRLTRQGHGLGIGDLDGDKDPDLFIACAGFTQNNVESQIPSKIYFNDGKGVFRDSGQDLGDKSYSGTGVILFDADGDKDLDALVQYFQVPCKIYLNDGRGKFSDSGLAIPYEPAACDLDGDGDIDLFIHEKNVGVKVLINDGRGRFSEGWTQPDATLPYGEAVFGDFDRDGDMDVMLARADNDSSRPTVVMLNDGKGRFSDSGLKLPELSWGRFAVIDVNRDGALDVLICQYSPRTGGQPPTFWLNDGRGRFRESGVKLGTATHYTSGTTGDLDGDGDLDLFLASFSFDSGSPSVWFNRHK
jgi:hypothetical protein